MPPGEFVIGRSSSCNLALDDGLVSRRHALLRVTANEVVVEDLGSRNGVSINGTPISGPTPVKHLDRVTIGSQEMIILAQAKLSAAQTLQIERCFACGHLNEPSAMRCAQCGTSLQSGPTSAVGNATIRDIPVMPDLADRVDEPTKTATTFELITSIAEKSLQFGRYEEAARILGPTLERLRRQAMDGKPIDEADLAQGVRFALRLAEGPTPAPWLTWVFEVFTAREALMSEKTIDSLHELVRKSRYNEPRTVRAYLQTLQGRTWNSSQRFLVKRIEALERVIAA